MAPACLHTLLSLWYPTVRCLANHSPQPLALLPASLLLLSIWLSALMRARLHSMEVWGSMVSRETQDNGWIIKGSPVEIEDFFLISLPPPTQPTFHLFSCIPPAYPTSPPFFDGSYHLFSSLGDDPRLPYANEDTAVGLTLINTVQIFI